MIQRLNILNILNFRMTKAGLVWMDVSIDVGSSKPEGVTLSTYLYIYISWWTIVTSRWTSLESWLGFGESFPNGLFVGYFQISELL